MAIVDELIGRIGFQLTGADKVQTALNLTQRLRMAFGTFSGTMRTLGVFTRGVFGGMREELRDLRSANRDLGDTAAAAANVGVVMQSASGAAGGLRTALIGVRVAATGVLGIVTGIGAALLGAAKGGDALSRFLLRVRATNVGAEALGTNQMRRENLELGLIGATGFDKETAKKAASTLLEELNDIRRGVQKGDKKDIEKANKLGPGVLGWMNNPATADTAKAAATALGNLAELRAMQQRRPGDRTLAKQILDMEDALGGKEMQTISAALGNMARLDLQFKGKDFNRQAFWERMAEFIEAGRQNRPSQEQIDRRDFNNRERALGQQLTEMKADQAWSEAVKTGASRAGEALGGLSTKAHEAKEGWAGRLTELLGAPDIFDSIRKMLTVDGWNQELTKPSAVPSWLDSIKGMSVQPSNFGNDQRQVSITVNQQVTGETAPGAAAGAVNSALGKSTNAPTLNFGTP